MSKDHLQLTKDHQALLARAHAGDLQAVEDLPDSSRRLLEAAAESAPLYPNPENKRLTDDELDALIQRFSPGRHPKVALALAELLGFRAGERQRAMDELLDLAATYMADEIAKLAVAKCAEEPDEMTARRQVEVDGEWRP